ncbi:LGFP repeat-containing protein [Nocardia brevicatena]|uniref:LGFP repeat-containing protein n=1 Tax=Nocardia brevicatena TaxID=37327 RepID=UPI000309F7A4|nr:esterase [Nocardia brevicatena]
MDHFARRSAGSIIALAAAGLLVAGCGDDDSSVSDAVGSLTSAVLPGGTTPGKAGERTTAEGSPTETTGAEGTATGTATPNAGAGETKVRIPGGEEISVSGPIYQKYNENGGPSGTLGLPEGPEQVAPNGGRYQDFTGGSVFFNDETGTHIVWGDIREEWERSGGADGPLGFPTSDEENTPEGKKSEFQGGTITWNSTDRSTTVTEK